MSALSHEDLVARAFGALSPDEAARIDAAIEADPAARRAFDDVSAHLVLYRAVPPAPPAPRFAAMSHRLDLVARGSRRASVLARSVVLAAAVLLTIGVTAFWFARPSSPLPYRPAVEVTLGQLRTEFLVDSTEAPITTLRSESGAQATIDGRFEVDLAPGTEVLVKRRGAFEVSGRATFTADHRPSEPFQVDAGLVRVVDVGTRFTIDHSSGSRVLVTVDRGAVLANGIRVTAGQGIAFEGAKPTGPLWPLDTKPTISLERDGAPTKAGEPVTVRLVLKNPTDGWVAIPAPDSVRGPVFVEVVDPAGKATPMRITPEMLTGEARLAGGIPPRGNLALGIRFERTFSLPGTYRLRAVYQPLGAVERPVSNELTLEIH